MAEDCSDSPNRVDALEASGGSVEEALKRALLQLGATLDEVDVEILSAGGSRLLRRDAEARVRVVRRDRPYSESVDNTEPHGGPASDPPEDSGVDAPAMVRAEESATSPGEAQSGSAEPRRESRPIVESGDDLQEIVEDLLPSVLDRMGFIADIELVDENPLSYNIVGNDDFSRLIGPQGTALRSFGYLINIMAGRQLGQPSRVFIDVNGYMAQRADHLQDLAKTLADQVRDSQEPVTLEAMPANERRLIHMALAEDADVRTYSIGDSEERRVVISPKA